MTKRNIITIGVCLLLNSAFAQSITATVDRQKILIGEPIELKVAVRLQKGFPVSFLDIDTLPHFEVMDRSPLNTEEDGNFTNYEQVFKITSWDSGKWMIPPIGERTLLTKPIPIEVAYTPFDTSKPYNDIKDIVNVPAKKDSKWIWYVIGLALLIILFLLFFPKGRKKEKVVEVVVPPGDAYKEALTRLDKLNEKDLYTKDVKLFYSELVNILRDYLHKRKDIHTYTRTTDDLSIQIGKLGMNNDLYLQLLQALRSSDMVKFAKFQPLSEENRSAMEIIRKSIIEIEKGNAV
jgi:hypothetical protein